MDKPGLVYEYEVCVKYFLSVCTKREWRSDFYDMTDPTVRKMLNDMGFTAVSERRWGV